MQLFVATACVFLFCCLVFAITYLAATVEVCQKTAHKLNTETRWSNGGYTTYLMDDKGQIIFPVVCATGPTVEASKEKFEEFAKQGFVEDWAEENDPGLRAWVLEDIGTRYHLRVLGRSSGIGEEA